MYDFWKVGTSLRDEFWYRSKTTFTGVTGKVQANFTIKLSKNGVGNQSTTGITITEVDATNNPGLYAIVVSGSTGFTAATGEYTLTINDTSSPEYSWESTFVVTSDGTGLGTLGGASFTSTTGNGRVTDGTSALNAATVYIRDPAGVLYTLATTNSSGQWGPVYFDRDGTWTGYVQKAGYSVASFSIVTSGATATGPGADVSIPAISIGSGLTLGELMSYGRMQVRDSVGTKADTQLKSAINDALGMIARERKWPWYDRQGTMKLNGAYSTGTLALTQTSAVVTLTGGTFPTWVSSDCCLEVNGQWHRISTRDSGTQVTLVTAWGEASVAASTYTVFQDEYALPSDCLRFGRIFPGTGWVYGGEPTSFEGVLAAKNAAAWNQRYPCAWGIHKDRFVCWPWPSTDTNLQFVYSIKPAVLTSTTDAADWDPVQLEVLQRAIDYQCALRFGATVSGDPNGCMARYQAALAKAAPTDKTPRSSNPFSGGPRSGNPWEGSRLV
jgi:hypothetical protein